MKRIAVYPLPQPPALTKLFESLARTFDVTFSSIAALEQFAGDALLLWRDDDGSLLQQVRRGTPVYSAPSMSTDCTLRTGEVRFTSVPPLDHALRGVTLAARAHAAAPPLTENDFVSLAMFQREPVWQVAADGATRYRVALPLVGLSPTEELTDVLHESAFPALLPLVDFIRRVSTSTTWTMPALRATLIIDDPNLHYPCYGYIDYASLAERARHVGFHANIATVPLDNWFVNRRAVSLFREHTDVLSLSVHGNDHAYEELARPKTDEEAQAIVAQALSRIERLERDTSVLVDRVMVPPYGMCGAPLHRALAEFGFYGLTTTRTLVWRHVDGGRRTESGVGLAEILCGLPIVQRFRFNSPRWAHRVAISAYLRQPIVAYGHHEDFASGPDAFDAVATRINQLGATWMNPATVFTSNFVSQNAGATFVVKPFSRRVVALPAADSTGLRVDLQPFRSSPPPAVRIAANGVSSILQAPSDTFALTPGANAAVSISIENHPSPPSSVKTRATSVATAVRRTLSEFRDRRAQFGLRTHATTTALVGR